MATSLLGRVYQSSLSQDLDFETGIVSTSYQVAYLVRVDDDCDDEAEVLATSGLPLLAEESSIYAGLYVSSRSATESDQGGIWTVTLTYTNPQKGQGDGGGGDGGGGGSGGPSDPNTPPWDQPWKTSYSSQRKQSLKTQMIYFGAYAEEVAGLANEPRAFIWQDATKCPLDAYGNKMIPVTNSAGEPIFYDGERVLGVYTVQSQHLGEFFPSLWLKRVGTLNRSNYSPGFYGSQRKGNVLLETVDIELEYWSPPSGGTPMPYYTMTRKFIVDPLGHWVEFADMGGLYFSSRRSLNQTLTEAKRAVDKDGNPAVLPLNGEGGLAEDGTSPMFLRYCPYPIGDW